MAIKRKSRSRKAARATGAYARTLEVMHQIWLAGLGAVSKAQRGTPQLLDELIQEGARVHNETRGAAEKAVREMLGGVQSTITARMGEVRGKTADVLDNLEKIFQTRVHRALTQIGVPSAEEVAALSKQVDALNSSIERLARGRKVGGTRVRTVRKAVSSTPAH